MHGRREQLAGLNIASQTASCKFANPVDVERVSAHNQRDNKRCDAELDDTAQKAIEIARRACRVSSLPLARLFALADEWK